MVVLQVALDLTELVRAASLAAEIASVTKCGNVWIEAGTPLIKSWGRVAVKALKDLTGCFVIADTKTMDVPSVEGSMMYEAGADAFTVLAVADDETIKEAGETARSYGRAVIGDLISHPKPLQRAIELYGLGVDAVTYHIGISVQKARGLRVTDLLDEVDRIKRETPLRVAVAGGIRPGDVMELTRRGVDVIVIGSAVTNAVKPVDVVTKVLDDMRP
ncbi:MAG: orotidine 5'-phosphate decarboxylase / HUMPS family protein [Zestosphaera sp.]